MLEPVSALSTLSSGLTAAVTAANFVFALHNTPKDVRACAQLVTRVYDDLQYLVTLRNSQQEYLNNAPFERQRVDGIINDASKSLLAIGSKLEACRAEANGGKVPWIGRAKWVLGDSASFVLHSRNLGVQHAAVNTEIAWLRSLRTGKEQIVERAGRTDGGEVFENLELLRLSSKKSTIFRETQSGIHPTPPPPYEKNFLSWNNSTVGASAGQAQLDNNQNGWDFYLDPARSSTDMNPQQAPAQSTIRARRPVSTNSNDIEHGSQSFLQAQPNNRRVSLQQLRTEPNNLTNALLKNSLHIEGKQVDVELESRPRQRAPSFEQRRPENRYTTSFTDVDEVTNSHYAEMSAPHQAHRDSTSMCSPISSYIFSYPTSPISTQDPYMELDSNQGPFKCQDPLPPLRPPRTPNPKIPMPTDNVSRATVYPNSDLSWLPNSAEWFPTPETSYQVPYMAASAPAPLQVPQEETDFSVEKIAVTYTPFSYKSAPWSGTLPEPVVPTRESSRMTIEDSDKMTTSSLENMSPTTFYSATDFETKTAALYSYASTPNLPSPQRNPMTQSSYAPTPVGFSDRDGVSRMSSISMSDTGQDNQSRKIKEFKDDGKEDTHDAFFKDLKLQEMEKRKRVVAHNGGNGWRNRDR